MNTNSPEVKPVCYITPRQFGLFGTREALVGTVRPVQYGEFSIPLFLRPPKASDDALVLLLTGIDLMKRMKGNEYAQWVRLAREVVNPGKAAGEAS